MFDKKSIVLPVCLFHTCLAVSSYYILHFADIHARPCQIEDHLRWINGNTSQISDEQDHFGSWAIWFDWLIPLSKKKNVLWIFTLYKATG